MSTIVHCRYCKEEIDKNDDNWIMPSKGWYYHKDCFIEKDKVKPKKEKKEVKPKKGTIRKCVYCGKEFDIDEGYRMPRTNRYAHIRCYEEHYSPDEEFIGKIYKLLKEDVGMTFDYPQCERQRIHFITKLGYSNEGIYNALKYHYLVKKGSVEKSGNRIGIVSYVYNEAQEYYKNIKKKQNDLKKVVESQMKEKPKQIIITKLPDAPKRTLIDLDSIKEDDDE